MSGEQNALGFQRTAGGEFNAQFMKRLVGTNLEILNAFLVVNVVLATPPYRTDAMFKSFYVAFGE